MKGVATVRQLLYVRLVLLHGLAPRLGVHLVGLVEPPLVLVFRIDELLGILQPQRRLLLARQLRVFLYLFYGGIQFLDFRREVGGPRYGALYAPSQLVVVVQLVCSLGGIAKRTQCLLIAIREVRGRLVLSRLQLGYLPLHPVAEAVARLPQPSEMLVGGILPHHFNPSLILAVLLAHGVYLILCRLQPASAVLLVGGIPARLLVRLFLWGKLSFLARFLPRRFQLLGIPVYLGKFLLPLKLQLGHALLIAVFHGLNLCPLALQLHVKQLAGCFLPRLLTLLGFPLLCVAQLFLLGLCLASVQLFLEQPLLFLFLILLLRSSIEERCPRGRIALGGQHARQQYAAARLLGEYLQLVGHVGNLVFQLLHRHLGYVGLLLDALGETYVSQMGHFPVGFLGGIDDVAESLHHGVAYAAHLFVGGSADTLDVLQYLVQRPVVEFLRLRGVKFLHPLGSVRHLLKGRHPLALIHVADALRPSAVRSPVVGGIGRYLPVARPATRLDKALQLVFKGGVFLFVVLLYVLGTYLLACGLAYGGRQLFVYLFLLPQRTVLVKYGDVVLLRQPFQLIYGVPVDGGVLVRTLQDVHQGAKLVLFGSDRAVVVFHGCLGFLRLGAEQVHRRNDRPEGGEHPPKGVGFHRSPQRPYGYCCPL